MDEVSVVLTVVKTLVTLVLSDFMEATLPTLSM